MGFVKAFGFHEFKELTLPVSRPMGCLWLTATFLFLIYGILYFINYKFVWLPGLLAIAISQILLIVFWQDAKIGTIPNMIILMVSIVSLASYNFQNRIKQESHQMLSQNPRNSNKILTETDILDLPEIIKNWLRNSGAVGRPVIRVGQVKQKLELQMRPDQKNWMRATATQYTTIDTPAFIWSVKVPMNALLYFQGRDKFDHGKGEMLIKINSLINAVNGHGENLDEATMQRYLGEMVWFPSLALSPYISWEQLNDTTAIANMVYKGTKGSGTFCFDQEGNFVKFTAMRFKDNAPDAKRYEWVLTVDNYQVFSGIKVPSSMKASWILEDGEWNWLVLQIMDLKYNESIE